MSRLFEPRSFLLRRLEPEALAGFLDRSSRGYSVDQIQQQYGGGRYAIIEQEAGRIVRTETVEITNRPPVPAITSDSWWAPNRTDASMTMLLQANERDVADGMAPGTLVKMVSDTHVARARMGDQIVGVVIGIGERSEASFVSVPVTVRIDNAPLSPMHVGQIVGWTSRGEALRIDPDGEVSTMQNHFTQVQVTFGTPALPATGRYSAPTPECSTPVGKDEPETVPDPERLLLV